jgi:pyruvate dehydrogenase complex dehydrogenase (E1) component
VILAKTIKGWTLGSHFEGRNSTHQMKKLTLEDLKGFRDRLYLDIPDSALDEKLPPYYWPRKPSEMGTDLSYQESTTGVLLHEGITEAGSAASWTAAGTSYATHGEPMIPIYIFYSMFGFQRTGSVAAVMRCLQVTRGSSGTAGGAERVRAVPMPPPAGS